MNDVKQWLGFNRYIVECKYLMSDKKMLDSVVLIDT